MDAARQTINRECGNEQGTSERYLRHMWLVRQFPLQYRDKDHHNVGYPDRVKDRLV